MLLWMHFLCLSVMWWLVYECFSVRLVVCMHIWFCFWMKSVNFWIFNSFWWSHHVFLDLEFIFLSLNPLDYITQLHFLFVFSIGSVLFALCILFHLWIGIFFMLYRLPGAFLLYLVTASVCCTRSDNATAIGLKTWRLKISASQSINSVEIKKITCIWCVVYDKGD